MGRVIGAAILLLIVAGCAGERAATALTASPATAPLPSHLAAEQEEPIDAGELIDEALLARSSGEQCLVDTDFTYDEDEYEGGQDTVQGAAAVHLDRARIQIKDLGSIVEERLTVDQFNALLAAQDVVSVLSDGRVITADPEANERVVVGLEDTDPRPAGRYSKTLAGDG